MNVAVLCNGPSRNLFDNSSEYDCRIGCNIPWTKVDFTVIMDVGVLDKWNDPCKFYASVKAWSEFRKKDRFRDHLIELFVPSLDFDTSGHVAVRRAIMNGATTIDIYGCDSWFSDNTESYTHKYVDGRAIDMSKQISGWRAKWNSLIHSNPDVKINFIGENDEIISC